MSEWKTCEIRRNSLLFFKSFNWQTVTCSLALAKTAWNAKKKTKIKKIAHQIGSMFSNTCLVTFCKISWYNSTHILLLFCVLMEWKYDVFLNLECAITNHVHYVTVSMHHPYENSYISRLSSLSFPFVQRVRKIHSTK